MPDVRGGGVETMIRILNLTKSFGAERVLRGVTETIRPGEVIAVIGPSGSGKSTLLRCINLLERPDGGEILVDGRNILAPDANQARVRRKIGMVFQSFHLFPHLTALENVAIGPEKILRQPRRAALARGRELLAMVGLAGKTASMPSMLSGGQQQRVAIARCLAMDPDAILFDEPTSALDPAMISEVLAVIRRLARDGMTMMIVTHELNFARDVASRICYMDEGVIYESGPPARIMDNAAREKTRAFINRLRNFSYRIDSQNFDAFAMNAAIESFCEKHFFSPKLIQHTLLAVEESLALHFARPDPAAINVTISYAEKSGTVEICFDDRQPLHNFLEDTGAHDGLELKILRGIAHDVAWEPLADGNRVRLTLNAVNRGLPETDGK